MTVKFNAKNKVLFNYLIYLFPPNPSGTLRVTIKNDFGRLVVALVSRSPDEVPLEKNEFTVNLRLPKNTLTKNAELCYLYFTDQNQARLNLLLDALFNLDLNTYYQKGCKRNIPKRDIIEAFVVSRRLFVDDFAETLGKRIYREQLHDFRDLITSLYEKARYNNDRIEGPDQPPK